jgi:hypothetical protein
MKVNIYWIEQGKRLAICNELGPPTTTNVNGKTIADVTPSVYAQLLKYETDNILRLTNKESL